MNKLNCIIVCLFLIAGCLFEVQGQTNETVVEESMTIRFVEEPPEYPDGEEACMKFVQDNIKYPKKAAKKGVQGIVWVYFIVEEDGNITDVEIAKSVHKLLDKEAMRVTKLMPKWNPRLEGGLPIRGSFNMPVPFKLKD